MLSSWGESGATRRGDPRKRIRRELAFSKREPPWGASCEANGALTLLALAAPTLRQRRLPAPQSAGVRSANRCNNRGLPRGFPRVGSRRHRGDFVDVFAARLRAAAATCSQQEPALAGAESRRFLLRFELAAAFFHLYGIKRDDTANVLDTFPIVRRKDEAAHVEYRTNRVILEICDEMRRAIESGRAYETRLQPGPADREVAHPPRREL